MGKEEIMHRDFPNHKRPIRDFSVQVCGHEDKTQTGNLYSPALLGFGALLCQGL
jgi:hypothetical protein